MRNKGQERNWIEYAREFKIVDLSGKVYAAASIEMGGKTGGINEIKLVPETDYEVVLTFDNVQGGVKKAQVLSFPFQRKTVNLRNITISN